MARSCSHMLRTSLLTAYTGKTLVSVFLEHFEMMKIIHLENANRKSQIIWDLPTENPDDI